MFLDSDDRLNTAAIHVLHHEMNLSFVVENTVVAHKHGAKGLDHVEFVVKLMTFIFVKQVDDLKRTQLRLSSWC